MSAARASPVRAAGALLVAIAAVSPGALAHQSRLAAGALRLEGDRLECELRFAAADLASLAPPGADGTRSPAALQSAQGALVRATLGGLVLTRGGAPCPLDEANARAQPDGGDGIVLRGHYLCPPAPPGPLAGRADLLAALPPGETLLLRIAVERAPETERVLQQGAESFSVELEGAPRRSWLRLLRLGVEHIFTGADHLCFLLALLLLGGSLGALARIVTAFTLAHSLTLALAALGILSPPAALIEPAIAASILFVAAENLWALRPGHAPDAAARALRHRWMAAFAFGLVHGFGFADALTRLHLPRAELLTSLVGFNLGVELGQLAVVALALPLLARLRRTGWFVPRGQRLFSLLLGAAGALWLVLRL